MKKKLMMGAVLAAALLAGTGGAQAQRWCPDPRQVWSYDYEEGRFHCMDYPVRRPDPREPRFCRDCFPKGEMIRRGYYPVCRDMGCYSFYER